jgi:hypothetical protein
MRAALRELHEPDRAQPDVREARQHHEQDARHLACLRLAVAYGRGEQDRKAARQEQSGPGIGQGGPDRPGAVPEANLQPEREQGRSDPVQQHDGLTAHPVRAIGGPSISLYPSFDSENGPRGQELGWASATGLGAFALTLLASRYLFWDSYLDLAAGRYIAAHGIPHREVFTIEGTSRPWIDQQWLAHWLYYECWSLGGYRLLAIFSSALVASAFAALTLLIARRGAPPQRAFLWAGFAYVACIGNTVIRAQSFAYLLFVGAIWLMLRDARLRTLERRFLLLVPLLALWANLHGTAALGAALACAYCAVRAGESALRRMRRATAAYACLSAAAPLLVFANPWGFGIWRYYTALVGNPVLERYIVEWRRPSPANPFSWAFFVLIAFVVAALVRAWRRRIRPDLLLVAASAGLLAVAMQAARYQAWFAIVGSILGADTIARFAIAPAPLAPRARRLGAVCLAACALAAFLIVLATHDRTFERLAPREAMAAAGAYLRSHPSARVLADNDSSSALLWTQPRAIGHIAFDARLEQFPQPRLRLWFEFLTLRTPGWPSLGNSYDAVLVTRRHHQRLTDALRASPAWRVAFEDESGSLFVRAPMS